VSLKTKALFLDRDGVINIDKGYVYKKEEFEFCDGVFETLRYAKELGYLLIVVTNQSGISRGYYTQEEFETLTAFMIDEFQKEGITIDKVYHCPHHPDSGCECRKPKPGMLLKAKEEFDIDLDSSVMIGDKKSDVEVAKNAGVKTKVFIGDTKESLADYCITSIRELKKILK